MAKAGKHGMGEKGGVEHVGPTPADEAFDMLRKQSQAQNVRLRTIAADFVEQLSAPATPSESADTEQ